MNPLDGLRSCKAFDGVVLQNQYGENVVNLSGRVARFTSAAKARKAIPHVYYDAESEWLAVPDALLG